VSAPLSKKQITPSRRILTGRCDFDEPVDYASAVLYFPSGVVITDPSKADNPIVFVNPAFTALTGYSSVESIGKNCRFLQGPLRNQEAISEIRQAVVQGHSIRRELLNYRKDGTQFWTDLAINPTRDGSGGLVSFVGILSDLTERKQNEAAAAEASAQLSSIVQNIPGFLFRRIRKPDGSIEFPYFSSFLAKFIGQPEERAAIAPDLWKHLHPDDVAIARVAIERSAAELSPLVLAFRLLAENGERWVRTYSTPRLQKNSNVIWDGVGIDITIEKLAESRLAYLAYHDPLTGLGNRIFLVEQLALTIGAARKEGIQIALSCLLVDGFSEINETLGMDEGDAMLKGIADRLSEFATLDNNTISVRLEGARFAILRRGITGGDADEFARNMLRTLAQPIRVGQAVLLVEPCVGTAILASDDLCDLSNDAAATELMKRAAIALSAANKVGTGTHRLYDEDLDHRRQHRMMLRHSMPEAIDKGQFELHYQPLVDLLSGRIVSAEALVRWQHPELGLLTPDLFIALAEESGWIGPLGEWVMRTAMREMMTWNCEGLASPIVALNVSSVQLKMPDFIETIRRALAETGADARKFDLELTEGILLDLSPQTRAVLAELKLLGFRLVIDDFGAGHSSFQYLRNLPVDKLKIDRIFVRELVAGSSDALIIRAIISLAQSLKIGLIAEGIETVEQRNWLRDQGCRMGQGYFFSEPLAAEDFAWMIKQKVVLPIASMEDRKIARSRLMAKLESPPSACLE
jgi:PAS domain S-box-containing protein/diguanylate cyclase (GGDEF)-like protein